MKKCLLLLSLFFMCGLCRAQGYIDHIVQRGETLEFLASKFGVSEQDIRDQNEDFDLDQLFVGLPLQIPIHEVGDSPEEIERLIASQSATNSMLSEANLLYANGSYRKAAKLYTAAIKENATSDLYYLRGRCHLHQGKFKSAIKDLEMANVGSDLSKSLRSSCELLLADAHKKRDAQLEARGEFWGEIFAVAAVTAATAAAASTVENSDRSRSTSSSYPSSHKYDLPPELQPEIAARRAVAQMNYNMEMEKENFVANYRAAFKRNMGREPSDMEIMEAYTNYLKARYGDGSEINIDSKDDEDIGGNPKIDPIKTDNTRQCPSCQNLRRCSQCRGSGIQTDNLLGQGQDPSKKCGICRGTGRCMRCNNTGRVPL